MGTKNASNNGTLDLFYDFCGGVIFWDEALLSQEVPVFTTCFLDTALLWFPCAFLWISASFFLAYLYHGKQLTTLPFSKLHGAKVVLSCLLACMVLLQLILEEHYGYDCNPEVPISPAFYTAVGLKFATFVLTVLLQQVQRVRGLKTSAVPFCFWLFMLVAELLPLYAHANKQEICPIDVVYFIYYVLLGVQLVLHCWAEQYTLNGYQDLGNENPCPDENVSILNHVTFHWLTTLVWQCYRRTFVAANFWQQTSRLKSDYLGPLLEAEWRAEVNRCRDTRCRVRAKLANGIEDKSCVIENEATPLLQSGSHVFRGRTVESKLSRPSLFRVIYRVFILDWLEATGYIFISVFFWFAQPLVLRYIIVFIENKGTELSVEPQWKGILYGVLLFLTLAIDSVIFHVAFHHMQTLGLKVKTALICLIYKKSLTMKRSGPKSTTVGEIVNLMSVDCQRIQDSFTFSFWVIIIFVVIGIATAQLWAVMGVAYLGSLSVMLILLTTIAIIGRLQLKIQNNLLYCSCGQSLQPDYIDTSDNHIDTTKTPNATYIILFFITGVASLGSLAVMLILLTTIAIIGRLQRNIQNTLLYLKGGRIKILNEVISGIKVLKMYAWEPSFMKKIKDIRRKELTQLWRYAILTTITTVLSQHGAFFMNFVLVLIYVMTSPTHSLHAEEAFTALSIVSALRAPLALCPFVVNGIVQAFVSITRIQEFLRLDDLSLDNVQMVESSESPVSVDGGDFTWSADSTGPVLRNINMRVRTGELIAVVGQVGSGKSSLMAACLGEMEKLRGNVTLSGKIAYVPQVAWIQNLTLRDNILFGKDYHERKYSRILDACALLPDLQILPGGDMTEIGERGINISGGQKQRVSLARAVYNNADVYFMDDPLSAVDSHVGKHLFQKVIGNEGLLKNKTRILVTHGVHWLPMVDRIVVLSNGTISESGTYEDLVSHDGDFAKFLQQYLMQMDEDIEDPELQHIQSQMRSKVEEIKSDAGLTSDDDVNTTGVIRKGKRPVLEIQTGQSSKQQLEDHSRLTAEERSEKGAIKPVVLLTYMKAMGYLVVATVFTSISIFQALNVFSNFWLTYWTEDDLLLNVSRANTPEYEDRYMYYLLMYLMLGVIQTFFVALGFYMAFTRMVKASGILHNKMLASILRSPMSFFDTTPVGRIMNRFSSDVDIMDNKLPESFRLWTVMIFMILATMVVVSVTTPIFVAAVIPIAIFYAFCVRFYLPTARGMRRTESINRSPIYNHFSETITGASVIRAFKCAQRFIEKSRERVDTNTKFYYAANTGTRWIGLRLEMIGCIIAFIATILAIVSEELSGAQVGLSITYAVQFTVALNLVVLAISEMEMNIVSVERVKEYTSLTPEAEWEIASLKPDREWPRSGHIEFVGFQTRYREGLELVLRGVDFIVKDGEKIGIVGRTGAGKSSLTLCLFRLIESAGGKILIDGVDISRLGLHDLRTKLTILPQDPVIFSGSLRTNLDPFGRYDDAQVWAALKCAHLRDFVHGLREGLEYECGEGGHNLSVGQRQLVCLARTLLHKTKVLILDEATAAVDMETDDLIQDTIRKQFTECTIITVAHRLNTIMDYDRVMVLDAGLIKEFDSPQTLLQDQQGVFHAMAADAGLV